jgi:hypothetical protein
MRRERTRVERRCHEQEPIMSDLVQRLANGEHPIEVSLRPTKTVNAFKDSLDRGYVHVRFTDTQGGTELGVPIDRDRTDVSAANFDAPSGTAVIVGRLTLDYVPVTCIANIDLATLAGVGRLEIGG